MAQIDFAFQLQNQLYHSTTVKSLIHCETSVEAKISIYWILCRFYHFLDLPVVRTVEVEDSM